MNGVTFTFSFIGGCIAGIWMVAASIHYMLPDGWMSQWYGFPVAVTSVCIIIVTAFLCTFIASVISEVFSK